MPNYPQGHGHGQPRKPDDSSGSGIMRFSDMKTVEKLDKLLTDNATILSEVKRVGELVDMHHEVIFGKDDNNGMKTELALQRQSIAQMREHQAFWSNNVKAIWGALLAGFISWIVALVSGHKP